MRRAVSVAVELRGKGIAFSKCISLCQLKGMKKVTKKSCPLENKSQKLPCSAQKVLLRASILCFVFCFDFSSQGGGR